MNINEVADYWQVSRRTVERAISKGKLRYVLFGEYKRVKVFRADVFKVLPLPKKLPLPDEEISPAR